MKKLLATLILLTITPASVLAEDKISSEKHSKMDHSQHQKNMIHNSNRIPLEAGNDGFAAIAEIVRILSDNPNTDWSKVNINGLRNHLLDMDRLVTGAKVEEQNIIAGVRFNVTGEAETLNAIQQMVPAHANELSKMTEYNATTESIENGVALTVTSSDDQIITKIKGLGFFGLMATGAHHQSHHLGMATGQEHGMKH